MIIDEPLLYLDSHSKYRAAFIRISHSSSVLRNYTRGLMFSILASTSSAAFLSIVQYNSLYLFVQSVTGYAQAPQHFDDRIAAPHNLIYGLAFEFP
jgi:hypothetical protein